MFLILLPHDDYDAVVLFGLFLALYEMEIDPFQTTQEVEQLTYRRIQAYHFRNHGTALSP
jgi:hypothetical protein